MKEFGNRLFYLVVTALLAAGCKVPQGLVKAEGKDIPELGSFEAMSEVESMIDSLMQFKEDTIAASYKFNRSRFSLQESLLYEGKEYARPLQQESPGTCDCIFAGDSLNVQMQHGYFDEVRVRLLLYKKFFSAQLYIPEDGSRGQLRNKQFRQLETASQSLYLDSKKSFAPEDLVSGYLEIRSAPFLRLNTGGIEEEVILSGSIYFQCSPKD